MYDVGHQDGVDYLVMEFLEGETLADRLGKGPLPLQQVLKCGRQISTDGGYRTWWVGHGENTELLYLDGQSRLASVPVSTKGGTVNVGAAQLLLGGRSLANAGAVDITRDGQRIMLSQPQPNANTALTLVLNWAAVLKK